MTNVGKLRYQEIPIPENLEQVIWSAIRQEERREDQPQQHRRNPDQLFRGEPDHRHGADQTGHSVDPVLPECLLPLCRPGQRLHLHLW